MNKPELASKNNIQTANTTKISINIFLKGFRYLFFEDAIL